MTAASEQDKFIYRGHQISIRVLYAWIYSWELAAGGMASCHRLEPSASQLTERNASMIHNYLAHFLHNAVLWLRLDIPPVFVARSFHYVTVFVDP